jgi:gliding motility-associated-like protein
MLRFFNAFTPNGDGKSDAWTIENITLPEFSANKVEIFNRWGQSIYTADNYNNADVVWKGESPAGQNLPAGTYFYVVNVAGMVHKGYIELIR